MNRYIPLAWYYSGAAFVLRLDFKMNTQGIHTHTFGNSAGRLHATPTERLERCGELRPREAQLVFVGLLWCVNAC